MSDTNLDSRRPTVGARPLTFAPPAVCRRLSAILSLFVLLSLCGCAGYQIGNQSLYPQEVHSVYVPVFKSNSFRRNLGERLTEAVVKEIEATTPYKVVDEAHADTTLSGAIIQETKTVLVPDLSGDAREVQAAISVQVSWTDRNGVKMRDDKCVPLPPEIADVSGSGNLVPEVGQSVATAQQEAICRIAKQIVGLMEKPW
ncbi:MAG: LptE family protein [Thermoguttaceae bacterium]